MSDRAESEVVPAGSEPASPDVQILKIKSRFAMLALREGGKPASAALQAADNFLKTEQDRYQTWLADAVKTLSVTLDELPGTIPDALQAAYVQTGHIRDLGGTFGAPLVSETADSLCELLYRLRSAGLYSSEAIAAHLSVLRVVCAGAAKASECAELIAGLRKMVARYPRPLPAQAEPQPTH